MSKRYEIVVPFTGFYESTHSDVLDQEVDYILEDNPTLDYDDLVIDTKGFYKEYAEAYVEAVVEFLENECDITIDLVFKEVNSPREYNFETDQIIAYISEEGIKQLLYNTDWKSLGRVIKEALTSRSGLAQAGLINWTTGSSEGRRTGTQSSWGFYWNNL